MTAMAPDRLTQRERAFAEQNHGLLMKFMRCCRLDDELYGALSLRYLKTVRRYLRSRKLRRYAFSTILWLNLRSELSHELRRSFRAPIPVPLDENTVPGRDLADGGSAELRRQLERILTERELEVLRLHLQGRNYREIARSCRITPRAVAGRLYRLRKKIAML